MSTAGSNALEDYGDRTLRSMAFDTGETFFAYLTARAYYVDDI